MRKSLSWKNSSCFVFVFVFVAVLPYAHLWICHCGLEDWEPELIISNTHPSSDVTQDLECHRCQVQIEKLWPS